jgi:hypothetical protein
MSASYASTPEGRLSPDQVNTRILWINTSTGKVFRAFSPGKARQRWCFIFVTKAKRPANGALFDPETKGKT